MSNGEHETERLPEPVAAQPPAVRPSTDLVESMTRLDRAIKARRDSDTQLINWWIMWLVLSWLTFGIYLVYNYYQRMSRIDGFSRRKRAYYQALLEWTEREAATRGKEEALHTDLADLRGEATRAYQKDLREINAPLSLVITILTAGLYGLYVVYRLNRYWWDAQVFEQDFDDGLSRMWSRLGIVKYPINFQLDQSKRRDFWLYLVLSIVTFGIWALVWDYKLQVDPDNLYGEYHSIEDTVLQTIRAQ
jgi:hypothetical protein